ncbi:transporter substrate-binding domain-containing protein [Amycolatopsis jejuensis]|uniref:transporter substrate-binding domain-containing protein n=1 Tax=Amycolatopsis jejuensis TaxID=330084 RepID=UPI000526AA21|nr:transporter substrate-binding domain-containing protein [Amycolatopsis jejuensis]
MKLSTKPRPAARWTALAACAFALAACSGGNAAGSGPASSTAPVNQELRNLLPDSVKKSNVVRVGAMFNFAPTVMVVDNGSRVTGTAPDLAKAVGDLLGVEFKYVNLDWPGQLPALQSSTVEVLWGQISDTAEREKSVVDLVSWYRGAEMGIIPTANPHQLKALPDACGLRIAAPVGSTQQRKIKAFSDKCVEAGKQPIDNPLFRDVNSAINSLRAGNIDGYMDTGATLGYAAKQSAGAFTTIPAGTENDTSGIAVAKSQTGLTKAIHGALVELVRNGTYLKILKTYGVETGAMPEADIRINYFTGTPVGAKQ